MKNKLILFLVTSAILSACSTLKDGTYNLDVLSTNDVHGRWFDKPFSGAKNPRGSLFAVYPYIKAVRDTSATVLIDAGDAINGGEANFYYNYYDTLSAHLFPRIAAYMGYDAFIPGPDDIETGLLSARVEKEFKKERIPVLYEDDFVIIKRAGLRIAILGSSSAIKDAVRKRPDVVIVKSHSKKLPEDLSGIDFVLAAHDHSNYAKKISGTCIIDAGSYARNIGHGHIRIVVKNGKVVERDVFGSAPAISIKDADNEMKGVFKREFDNIEEFVKQPVGKLENSLVSRQAYTGMSDYMNLYHSLALSQKGVDISMSAPLAIDGVLEPGEIRYDNISKLYPFDNKLLVIRMTGREVLDYLETSYDGWINTMQEEQEHIFRLKETKDIKTGKTGLGFAKSPANFDSAAGICYTVDVTKPKGNRISISCMADGSDFSLEKDYNVGITSYRSSGAGGLLSGAGIDPKKLDERIVCRYPEFRTLLYKYLKSEGKISADIIGRTSILGTWKFIPENIAEKALKKDMSIVFEK